MVSRVVKSGLEKEVLRYSAAVSSMAHCQVCLNYSSVNILIGMCHVLASCL